MFFSISSAYRKFYLLRGNFEVYSFKISLFLITFWINTKNLTLLIRSNKICMSNTKTVIGTYLMTNKRRVVTVIITAIWSLHASYLVFFLMISLPHWPSSASLTHPTPCSQKMCMLVPCISDAIQEFLYIFIPWPFCLCLMVTSI